jgi:hypothetical protein
MKEHQPIPDNQYPPGKVSETIIFDKDGHVIGVSINDGSLDYVPQGDNKNKVVVIKPANTRE